MFPARGRARDVSIKEHPAPTVVRWFPMTRVLFVCHGNICRSPLAEGIFRDMVERQGLSDRISCASCATSDEHTGQSMDPRSDRLLREHGIVVEGKTARRLNAADFEDGAFDYILGMDRSNLSRIEALRPADYGGTVGRLKDYSVGGDVEDPWYSGNFPSVYDDIQAGCLGLLRHIRETEGI